MEVVSHQMALRGKSMEANPSETMATFNARQERIFHRLALLGSGPPQFFENACRLIANREEFEAAAVVIAHLFREVESSLISVLSPITNKNLAEAEESRARVNKALAFLREMGIPDSSNAGSALLRHVRNEGSHAKKIRAISDDLGLENERVSASWIESTEERPWTKWAHRDALAEVRPFDSSFETKCEEFEEFLDRVLEVFELRYADALNSIEEIATKSYPTSEDLNRIKNHLPSNLAVRNYLFSKIESSEWIGPLQRDGFFKRIPEPEVIVDGEQSITRTPIWPQSRFLARMALAGRDAEAIVCATRSFPATENRIVREDIVVIARALPSSLGTQLAPVIEAWCNEEQLNVPALEIGELIEFWACAGSVDPALMIFPALLRLAPVLQPPMPRWDGDGFHQLPPQPRSRIERSDYIEILAEHAPSLIAASGVDSLRIICDLLDDAIMMTRNIDEVQSAYDGSQIWLPEIGATDDLGLVDERSAITEAIRRVSEDFVSSEPNEMLPRVLDILGGYRWDIFRRLETSLLGSFAGTRTELADARLSDVSYLDYPAFWPEYRRLARERFRFLPQDARNDVLSWIKRGPAYSEIRARLSTRGIAIPTESQLDEIARRWKWQRLGLVREALEGDELAYYESLVAEFGEITDETRQRVYTSWLGFVSPKSISDLSEMRPREIILFAKEWEPPGGELGPSPRGLSRVLTSLVQSDPSGFAALAEDIAEVRPEYVRGIIEGFQEAIDHGTPIPWDSVLDLCHTVVEKPRGEADTRIQPFGDINFGPSRLQIALLIQKGLNLRSPWLIPNELRPSVWSTLRLLMEDPEPTIEHEQKFSNIHDQPWTLVTSAVRRATLLAVVEYSFWVRRGVLQGDYPEVPGWDGLSTVPEVRVLLDRHLDPTVDRAATVRSVLGWLLPQLGDLDLAWIRARRNEIFPDNPDLQDLLEATWGSYIVWSNPDVPTFEALKENYADAINTINEPWANFDWPGGSSPAAALAERLIQLYRIDLIDSQSGGLLDAFITRAPIQIRTHAMHMAMFGLADDIPQDMRDRLMRYWESRIEAAENVSADSRAKLVPEIAAFARWFESDHFGVNWKLRQLNRALHFCLGAGRIELARELLTVDRELSRLAHSRPSESVECFALLARLYPSGGALVSPMRNEEVILEQAISSDDPFAADHADRAARILVARGYLRFRRFVTGN